MEKFNIWRSAYLSKFHELLRLPRKVTFQLQQILRLPRKITLMIDPPHIIDVKYCACHEKCTLLFSALYSLGIYSLLAFKHLFPLGIYFLSIYSLLASILSWHLFSLGIYSLYASTLSASILSWHLFSLCIYSLGIYSL